jgi:ribosomal protein L7Ae-like RNA K-turn-binding protein
MTPKKPASAKPVERLFPFVLRSRALLVGRDTLMRSKSKLHFILITLDVSEKSRAEVLEDFAYYPVVQLYTSADLDRWFGLKGTKVIGFKKSGLAQSIYAELKEHRLNKPVKVAQAKAPADEPRAGGSEE